MAGLIELNQWEALIYQLEILDQVLAGPGEIANLQAQQLANRTKWLKDQLALLAVIGHNHDADYAAVGHNHDATYATPAYVDASAVPPGGILPWTTAVEPTGYLPCEGAAVSRVTYADLFAVIGTDYGVGNGATTFNLPDLRGQFLRGWDHGAGVDPDAATRTDRGDGTGGDVVGSKQDESDNAIDQVDRQLNVAGSDPIIVPSDGSMSDPIHTGESGAGTQEHLSFSRSGNEVRPENTSVLFVIKY